MLLCIGMAMPAAAQYADLDRADWKEDTVPPPPHTVSPA